MYLIAGATSCAVDHSGYLRRFKTGGGNTPTKTATKTSRPSSAPLGNKLGSDSKLAAPSGTKWLESRIDELVQLRFKKAEMSQLSDKLKELKADRPTVMSDIEVMRRQQQDGAGNINKQLVEVEAKILEISAHITADRNRLENGHRQALGNSADEEERAEEELRILTRISEAQRAVRSYQERQRELKSRLDNGVLNEAALTKMGDLQV